MTAVITRSTDAATVTPFLVLGPFEDEADGQSIVHDILGSSDSDVTLRPASTPTGSVELFFLTWDDAQAAREFHRAPAVFTLADPDAGFFPSSYIMTRVSRAQQDARARWVVTVEYREVTP